MGFLDDYDALSSQSDPQQAAKQQMGLLQTWLLQKPDALYAELRANRPIFTTPGPVLITRYRDVVEVLNYHQVFSVAPWGEAMRRNNGGPNFVLGMEDSAEYKHEISILRLAVRREDAASVAAFVAQTAQSLAAQLASKRTFDITDSYARLIPTLFVGSYFGVPGPNPTALMTWARQIFHDIFFNLTHDPQVEATAQTAAKALRDYNQSLIDQAHAAQKAGAPPADNVLGRLIAMQCASPAAFPDDRVRENLSGCLTGVIDNVCTGIVNAMDVLFAHPDQLPGAIAAAQSNNDDLLLRYVLEALRFRVPAPLLFRVSTEAHVLARGTARETSLLAQKLIFAATASAMMDETELENPQGFDLNRPMTHYLHFGWGLHECLGKYLATAQIVQAVKSLLRLKGIRRADGPSGELKYDGPFPVSFSVACEAA